MSMDGLYSCTFGVKMKQTPSTNNKQDIRREKRYAVSAMALFSVLGATKMSIDSRSTSDILLMFGISAILTLLVYLVIGGKLRV